MSYKPQKPDSRSFPTRRGMSHGMMMLVTILAVAIPGIWLAELVTPPRLEIIPWWVHIFLSPLAFTLVLYTTITIHEIGHAVASRLVGFDIIFIMVGPVQLTRTVSGWRWHFSGYGGFAIQGRVLSVPPISAFSDQPALKRKLQIVYVAGPLANFLQATALFLLLVYTPGQTMNQLVRSVLVSFTLFGGLFFVWSILPIWLNGVANDMARIIHLTRQQPEIKREIALFELLARSIAGERPREWNNRLIAQALSPSDVSPDALLGLLFAYTQALDQSEPAVAAMRLDGCLDVVGAYSLDKRPASIMWEAARYEAQFGQDLERANDWWHLGARLRPPRSIETQLLRAQTEALLAIANKNDQAAHKHAQKGLSLWPMLYNAGYYQPIKEQLESILATPTTSPQHNYSGRWASFWPIASSLALAYIIMTAFNLMIIFVTN